MLILTLHILPFEDLVMPHVNLWDSTFVLDTSVGAFMATMAFLILAMTRVGLDCILNVLKQK